MKIIIDEEYKNTLSQEQLSLLEGLKELDINELIPDEDDNEKDVLQLESD